MARLSTGQAFGETSRASAAQLLGGIPTDASGGALAQGSINAPALQSQARPVSTFQQVGAPTLGGAPKFFPLPDLPTPSQDLARLASALGNLSPVLGALGDSYVQQQKNIDAKAQAVGQAAAMQLVAPGQNFIQARDSLWRQAQAGDAGAAAAYQQMQALSPLQQAYTARYAGQAVLREDIGTAAERFKTITEIDGVPIDQIPPGDPRISGTMSALYRLPKNDPAGFAELMPLVAAKNGEISRLHMRMHLDRKVNEASSASQAALTSGFMGQDVDVPRIVADQSQMLTSARLSLGVEEYQKLVGNYGDYLSSAVLAGSMGKDGKPDPQRYHYLMGKAIDVFTQVQAGPNGELLLTTLGAKGGTAAQLALTQKMMVQLKTFNESVDSFDGSIGEDKGAEILAITNAEDPSLTPAQRDERYTQADLMRAGLDSRFQAGAAAVINKSRTQSNTSWTRPMQEKVERETSFSYDKDPATEIRRFEQLKVNGLIDPRYADRMIGQYRDLQSADLRPAVNAAKLAKARIMEQEMAAMKLPGSEGGTAITKKESLFLINRDVELSNSIETMRRQTMADGSGQEGFQNKLEPWVQKQEARAPKPANPSMVPLMPKGPEAWMQGLGLNQLGPGNRAANHVLRQQVDNGVVMPPAEFFKNYDDYVENGRLSDAMKLLIKRSGYGAAPSQFFYKQWDKMAPEGAKINPKDIELLKARDQQKISYAQPGAGGVPVAANPYMQTAANLNNLIRSAGAGALNVFMPPASAATLDSQGGGRYGEIPFTGSSSFERPASVVYERPGGQPGVDYWFPSKQFPAVLAGRVKDVGREPGYGNYVVIESIDPRNGRKVDVLYGHLPDNGIFVREGQSVSPGQVIGKQGGTGNVDSSDGTIASVDFLAPRPAGSRDMTPYSGFDGLRRYVTASLQSGGGGGGTASRPQPATTRRGGGMTGIVTYYTGSGGSDGVVGAMTANNKDRFNPNHMTAAVQRSLRGKYLDKWLLVEDLESGKSVRVYANDVGSMKGTDSSINRQDPRIVDLSPAAFKQLYGSLDQGPGRIRVRIDPNQRGRSPSRVKP
jgi:murein DD-endopeptidase MepM/ murein hydrolase activator NlpD